MTTEDDDWMNSPDQTVPWPTRVGEIIFWRNSFDWIIEAICVHVDVYNPRCEFVVFIRDKDVTHKVYMSSLADLMTLANQHGAFANKDSTVVWYSCIDYNDLVNLAMRAARDQSIYAVEAYYNDEIRKRVYITWCTCAY